MIKVFSTGQVKELDQYTIQHEPIAPIDLVERASTVFVREFTRHYSKQLRIVVFAGKGNNGADALAIARLLMEESYEVETYLFNPSGILSPECETNKKRLFEIGYTHFSEVMDDFEPPVLGYNDVVIDGLFGSGLTRSLEGGFAAVVNYINESDAQVVSIDIPSGLFGEDNKENNPSAIIKADMTLTFSFPKLAFFLSDNAPFIGEWKVLDIGLHPDAIDETDTNWGWVTEDDVAELIQPRKRFSHKGSFGHALLVAGSRGKMGAAILSARACLRSGAGLLTVHIPPRGELALQTAFPETMVSLDQHNNHFSSIPNLSPFNAIGVGPGIGQHMETAAAFERLLQTTNSPMVIDADALNLLASNNDLYRYIPPYSILTPHPKEFDRLAGESVSAYERLQKALSFAVDKKIIIVLKGAYTAICSPAGHIYFNNNGNPGMATAGSGDVLTGILLSLLAQGYDPEITAVTGVYLHGLSGDMAAAHYSEEGMIASDIIEMLGKAFKHTK